MTEQENTAIEFYRATLEKYKAAGMTRNNAKISTAIDLHFAFPDIKHNVTEHPKFWSRVSELLEEYYPIKAKAVPHALPLIESKEPEFDNFMDLVRKMARTGFVPYGKHIEPIVGATKAKQMGSYVSQIAKDGKLKFEKNGSGWIVTELETPEEAARRMVLEQIAALRQKIDELSQQVR